jgi:hypothetical protein
MHCISIKNIYKKALAVAMLTFLPLAANAAIVYDSWDSNDPETGNYIITVVHDEANNQFDVNFTVDPWNAEGLGVFIDLGDFDVPLDVGLTNVVPENQVTLFATDTTANSCGTGCNLHGVTLDLLSPDDEWELVFRLGSTGFDNIQTFSFTIDDFGLTEADWGLVGVRAQQLCTGDNLLPDGTCGGSDKSFGRAVVEPVPVPQTLPLIALGLALMGISRRLADREKGIIA